ncbi:MAG: nucleotide-binding protein [Candidatus Marinimicrobia bacterium]|nr:nucleotide-binding protein [Candidatus Neomarinimicrobiota bacterium]
MQKTKHYRQARFSADVIREALQVFRSQQGPKDQERSQQYLSVELEDSEWRHDTEDEFFADYRRSKGGAVFSEQTNGYNFLIHAFTDSAQVKIGAPERGKIEVVFEVFEKHAGASRLPDPPKSERPKPRIFIGHGGSAIWRDLKDHLQDKHGYIVEAYEIGARAGHTIRDILEEMLAKSSFAVLLMTGEDETAEGDLLARQNVVHEAGLFQGKLGFHRAIVLLEEGTVEFSNIHGIEQIRFAGGNIKETYGEVLATLKREFGENLT